MKWLTWRPGRRARISAALALGVVLAAGGLALHQERQRLKALRAQVAAESAALAALRTQSAAAQAQDTPDAWEETPDGLEPAPASRGVSKEDLAFLRSFRRPLLQAEPPASASGSYAATLARTLQQEFERDARLVDRPELAGRQRLIAYVLLRVNGSMPTYEIRPSLPHDFRELLLGTSGNCGDFAVRLMIALEALGFEAAMISSNTPAFPGHVFVDAYDPVEQRSYLLDANYNVIVSSPQARGRSFVAHWFDAADKKSFSELVTVQTFPVYFRFVDPGVLGFQSNALTPDAINEQRAEREQRWRRWLHVDAEALRTWWKDTPWHRPQTLRELAGRGAIEVPRGFDISRGYAKDLRVRAGLAAAAPVKRPSR